MKYNEFKIGDKVRINPIFKDDIMSIWYNKWEGEIMTVKKHTGLNNNYVDVEENSGMWPCKYLILYEEFLSIEEVEI